VEYSVQLAHASVVPYLGGVPNLGGGGPSSHLLPPPRLRGAIALHHHRLEGAVEGADGPPSPTSWRRAPTPTTAPPLRHALDDEAASSQRGAQYGARAGAVGAFRLSQPLAPVASATLHGGRAVPGTTGRAIPGAVGSGARGAGDAAAPGPGGMHAPTTTRRSGRREVAERPTRRFHSLEFVNTLGTHISGGIDSRGAELYSAAERAAIKAEQEAWSQHLVRRSATSAQFLLLAREQQISEE
jgi:hypothetical protein